MLEDYLNNYEQKRWLRMSCICPRCGDGVSNRDYWKGTRGSIHFRGECKPRQFFLHKIPEPKWKTPLPPPLPRDKEGWKAGVKGWEPRIDTMQELCDYWAGRSPREAWLHGYEKETRD